jgi:hypothetical protein
MITGEERLRENLASLYGSVVGYEGQPTEMQVARRRRLGGARRCHEGFRAVDSDRAAEINKMLEGGMPRIEPGKVAP